MNADQIKTLQDILPFAIPLVILQLTLMVVALIDLFKREGMSSNTRVVWVLVIVIINLIGPLAYFFFGRKDKPIDGD